MDPFEWKAGVIRVVSEAFVGVAREKVDMSRWLREGGTETCGRS
jgi:hypothetical protein